MTVYKTRDGAIYSITAAGHAGYAAEGEDIVCASVSSLMQALWIGLEYVAKARGFSAEMDYEATTMSLKWDPKLPEAQIIALTIAKSLEAVAECYPAYVKYRETV